MNYYILTIKETEYKLKLTTRNIVALEKDIGKNPIFLFSNQANKNLPTIEEMVKVLYHSLRSQHEDITFEGAYDILDSWLEDGHIISEFPAVITEIFLLSGIFKKGKN